MTTLLKTLRKVTDKKGIELLKKKQGILSELTFLWIELYGRGTRVGPSFK